MNRTCTTIYGIVRILIIAFTACPRPARADDWLPIPPEDLALKDNPKQPGADAMILYRQVVVDASKANISGDSQEEYFRIKIFTQEGTKEGHVEIEFQKQLASVTYVAGRTIRPDGSIVKFDGQVLETTVEKIPGSKYLAKTFTLPDVQPGCIIEYKYSIQGKPEHVLDWGWRVSQSIYTREARFSYTPYTGYGSNLRPIIRRNMLPADATPQLLANGSYLMVVHDVPGIVEEPLMPPAKAATGTRGIRISESGCPIGYRSFRKILELLWRRNGMTTSRDSSTRKRRWNRNYPRSSAQATRRK